MMKVELCSFWDGDRAAANAAWASTVSSEKLADRTDEQVRRVVTDIVHLHHDTPKERLWLEFFITLPIFCERQFDKYRMTVQFQDFQVEFLEGRFGREGITQNELSGRYKTIPDRPYVLPKDIVEIVDRANDHYGGENVKMSTVWQQSLAQQHNLYQYMLKLLRGNEEDKTITNEEYKRAREVLRGLLGTAYMTDMRIVMNMNAFEHIINQRLNRSTTAQMESRYIAYLMVKEVQKAGCCPTMIEEMIKANGWDLNEATLQEFAVGQEQ